jgi:hypothetical protein
MAAAAGVIDLATDSPELPRADVEEVDLTVDSPPNPPPKRRKKVPATRSGGAANATAPKRGRGSGKKVALDGSNLPWLPQPIEDASQWTLPAGSASETEAWLDACGHASVPVVKVHGEHTVEGHLMVGTCVPSSRKRASEASLATKISWPSRRTVSFFMDQRRRTKPRRRTWTATRLRLTGACF